MVKNSSPLLRWLTVGALFVGLISTVSYALSAPMIIRMAHPDFGAWWDLNQFYVMEGAATALGLLVGIRLSRRFVSDAAARARSGNVALILAIIALIPLMQLCAAAARMGWGARSAATQSVFVGHFGYATGKLLDKLLITGVYFFKTVGFAALAGLALFAVAAAIAFIGVGKSPEEQSAAA